MSEPSGVYAAWADMDDERRKHDFKSYAYNIAEARYVLRRISRILDEQAKQHDLDPLLHQAMLQIFGTVGDESVTVSALAERLDIPAAFASRLVTQLEERGLVQRTASERDRRMTLLGLTDDGVARLRAVDEAIHYQVAYFQHQLTHGQRLAALSIFAFYTGIGTESPIASALRSERAALAP